MVRRFRRCGAVACLIALALFCIAADVPDEVDLDDVVAQRMEINLDSAKSQERVDALSGETDAATIEYRTTLQRIDALRHYNHQMSQLVDSQEEEMAVLRAEIDGVELVAREMTPLMLAMIDALENFVELDVPFLPAERAKRIVALRELMTRSDVTNAERYRRILEAYQIENEYGRTIEAYEGELDLGGEKRQVEFLRIGRISLLYQTLDGAETGVWNHERRAWDESPESRGSVRKGLRIARKQTAPDLLTLPVPAAETAE